MRAEYELTGPPSPLVMGLPEFADECDENHTANLQEAENLINELLDGDNFISWIMN